MENDELLDLVNEKGEVMGTASRIQCMNNPALIHPVVHCWIFNKKGQVLWQQRSLNKDSEPGKWDMSCGGHIHHGEKPLNALKRELKEELGISKLNVKLIDKYVQKFPTQQVYIYLYYAIFNKNIESFKIDKRETQQLKWIDPVEAQLKYINNEVGATEFIVSQVTRILQRISFKIE